MLDDIFNSIMRIYETTNNHSSRMGLQLFLVLPKKN